MARRSRRSRGRTGGRALKRLAAAALIFIIPLGLGADSLMMTTWYPAPYGVYSQLRSTGNSYFAYQGGSVGIGTTSPQAKLHVVDGWIDSERYGDTGSLIARRANGSPSSPAPVLAGQRFASFAGGAYSGAYNGTGGFNMSAEIDMWAAENQTPASAGSYMTFGTRNIGEAPGPMNEKMRIDPGGNVGIGTTNPGFRLDVNGTASMTGFHMSNGASSNYVLKSDSGGYGTWQPAGLSCTIRSATQGSPGSYSYNTVSCQGNEKAMGGGCASNGDCGDSRVFGSYPNSPTSWACATAGCTTSKTAWVVCCQ